MRIKKNDQVIVISGKDKGKKGRVMKLYAADNKALVEKINYRKVAIRPTRTNPKGGIVEMEAKLDVSKLMLVCPRCNKPSRVAFTFLADKTKQRMCKSCHEVLGA